MPSLARAVMHLTHDDPHVVTTPRGTQRIDVRIRVWRRMGARAVVLVEAADPDRTIKPWTRCVAAHVEAEVFRGRPTEWVYVERTGAFDTEEFHVVHVQPPPEPPRRQAVTRYGIEVQVGTPV